MVFLKGMLTSPYFIGHCCSWRKTSRLFMKKITQHGASSWLVPFDRCDCSIVRDLCVCVCVCVCNMLFVRKIERSCTIIIESNGGKTSRQVAHTSRSPGRRGKGRTHPGRQVVVASGTRIPVAVTSGAHIPVAVTSGAHIPVAVASGAHIPVARSPWQLNFLWCCLIFWRSPIRRLEFWGGYQIFGNRPTQT
jgi:hypothetical protein